MEDRVERGQRKTTTRQHGPIGQPRPMQSTLTAVDNIGLPLILEARLSRLNDMLLQWGTIQQKKNTGMVWAEPNPGVVQATAD